MILPAEISPLRRSLFGSQLPCHVQMQPDQNLISGEWNTQPAVVLFNGLENQRYLKQEALNRYFMRIGDLELYNYMRMYGVAYYEATCDYDFPATKPVEVVPIVNEMNERTLGGIQQDNYASLQLVSLWRQQQHTGKQVGWHQPQRDWDGFDKTIETDLSQGWTEYRRRR
jgi:hypothetical protein